MNGDFIRGLTAFICGATAVGWVYVAMKARRLVQRGITVTVPTLRAFAAFFILLAVITFQSLEQRAGQPVRNLLGTGIGLLLMIVLTTLAIRDLRREAKAKS